MAKSTRISISPENTGLWGIKQSEAAAERVTELLQLDLNNHHVFLNSSGFHDHVPHHLLALYGAGAGIADIQKAYDFRHPLQKPVQPAHDDVIANLNQSWTNAGEYLGKDKFYPDFLAYFQTLIDQKGYEEVVNEVLFGGDKAANDLLVRLHAGLLHPLIQLMYGLEWKQPAIVAEALAETCVHELESLDGILLEAERRAGRREASPSQSLLPLYEQAAADHELLNCTRLTDRDKISEGIVVRAKDSMLKILEQVRVSADNVKEKTAEMFHAITFVASGAANRPPYHVKYDFFLMHHINSALLYPTINNAPWIDKQAKARMLEWKIRMDLVQYVARGCPPYSLQSIRSYHPKIESRASTREISSMLHDLGDDGHAIKQARATAVCKELVQKYEGQSWVVLKGDDVWRTIQLMVVDAVQGPGRLYVYGAGIEESWKDMPYQDAPKKDASTLREIILGQ